MQSQKTLQKHLVSSDQVTRWTHWRTLCLAAGKWYSTNSLLKNTQTSTKLRMCFTQRICNLVIWSMKCFEELFLTYAIPYFSDLATCYFVCHQVGFTAQSIRTLLIFKCKYILISQAFLQRQMVIGLKGWQKNHCQHVYLIQAKHTREKDRNQEAALLMAITMWLMLTIISEFNKTLRFKFLGYNVYLLTFLVENPFLCYLLLSSVA